MEKGNGSKPSLSSLMSSLYDSLNELTLSIDGDVSITGLLAIVASFQSLELQLQAMKDLLRQRKEAYIPKGKISSFFYFATLFDNKMTISEIETLQRPISLLTEVYTNMAMRLHPELFSEDTNPSLIQEDANNGISPEAVVVVPSPAEEMQQNNQIQNEPEPLRRESKTDSLVTEDG
ncbi:LOW QUALITY PROTEIN: uncharacterized protein LOC9312387 [Arabidopsis lyrata subsp. lyrata]|uniref:LOW QUALITY PROTEIN: uncharacterized protein LOC9312387 n=1 Tax=Arabidopsis lyrata subsp. lyrata TaxID=81972 RepID=UPI000A29C874|nr:LOW QUALITY PROTEIN: uncharacterized protein LOC9312387 [Arabidopsis lyrata subsp. lyrata]|eukprot:XP_020879647.1 LOW QUALITY PROTEIN: uncharacterized protein LOC9312387 [Arabidopsis lyrata subsp. lyrata]